MQLGRRGGKATARKVTQEQRRESVPKATQAHWAKEGKSSRWLTTTVRTVRALRVEGFLPAHFNVDSESGLDRERNASLSKALTETIVANSCLLVLTACLCGLIRYNGQVLEQEAAQS